MYYIIKSVINEKNLSDITHEVININPDFNESTIYFENYIKDIFKKYKRVDNVITFKENDNIITIQIHEDNSYVNEMNTDFIDDSGSNNESPSDNIEEFLDFKPDMSTEEVSSYMERINVIVTEADTNCENIINRYNKIVKKNGKLMVLSCDEKPLTLKF